MKGGLSLSRNHRFANANRGFVRAQRAQEGGVAVLWAHAEWVKMGIPAADKRLSTRR